MFERRAQARYGPSRYLAVRPNEKLFVEFELLTRIELAQSVEVRYTLIGRVDGIWPASYEVSVWLGLVEERKRVAGKSSILVSK